jgi:signal transduction histidine kinase
VTVRFKIAFTIFITGLLTAIGVIAAVLLAFERFDRETTYYRASAFLERVVARHTDMFALRERFAEDFNGFLANLVLFEADTQLYLLDAVGTVIATSADINLPKGFKVALGPVIDAAGPMPMPYVMGDDPAHGDANAVIAARPLRQAVIRNDAPIIGYLYMVSRQRSLPQGGWASLRSAFAQPALVLILAVVALSTLLAAWVTSVVTRPLARLTEAVAAVSRDGLEDLSTASAEVGVDPFGGANSTSHDEFGQLNNGIRMMLATLRTQWRTLRRLDHFRREGVSNLSHDLRSPLTATAACLETLQSRWTGDDARGADRQLVEVALRNTHNAARLVHSLGDLAQLDEPEFKLQTQVMDVLELLDDVALRFTERAARGGVRIASGESKGTTLKGVAAAVDVELFERAIANLVDNALKFCPAGASISLDAQQTATEVLVTVSDTGSGIAETDLPHLFDRFYQSRHSVAPATGEGGRGLGLAIVKRIVELHGGQVDVKSTLGVGTLVSLTLPLPKY